MFFLGLFFHCSSTASMWAFRTSMAYHWCPRNPPDPLIVNELQHDCLWQKKRQKKNGGWTVQQNHFPNPNKKDGQPKKMLNWMFPKSWGYAQFSSKSWIRPFDLYSIDMYRLTTMLLLDPNHCRSVGLPEIIPISVMNIPFMCIFLLVGGFNHLEKW